MKAGKEAAIRDMKKPPVNALGIYDIWHYYCSLGGLGFYPKQPDHTNTLTDIYINHNIQLGQVRKRVYSSYTSRIFITIPDMKNAEELYCHSITLRKSWATYPIMGRVFLLPVHSSPRPFSPVQFRPSSHVQLIRSYIKRQMVDESRSNVTWLTSPSDVTTSSVGHLFVSLHAL
jgi:hypothetical protein